MRFCCKCCCKPSASPTLTVHADVDGMSDANPVPPDKDSESKHLLSEFNNVGYFATQSSYPGNDGASQKTTPSERNSGSSSGISTGTRPPRQVRKRLLERLNEADESRTEVSANQLVLSAPQDALPARNDCQEMIPVKTPKPAHSDQQICGHILISSPPEESRTDAISDVGNISGDSFDRIEAKYSPSVLTGSEDNSKNVVCATTITQTGFEDNSKKVVGATKNSEELERFVDRSGLRNTVSKQLAKLTRISGSDNETSVKILKRRQWESLEGSKHVIAGSRGGNPTGKTVSPSDIQSVPPRPRRARSKVPRDARSESRSHSLRKPVQNNGSDERHSSEFSDIAPRVSRHSIDGSELEEMASLLSLNSSMPSDQLLSAESLEELEYLMLEGMFKAEEEAEMAKKKSANDVPNR